MRHEGKYTCSVATPQGVAMRSAKLNLVERKGRLHASTDNLLYICHECIVIDVRSLFFLVSRASFLQAVTHQALLMCWQGGQYSCTALQEAPHLSTEHGCSMKMRSRERDTCFEWWKHTGSWSVQH